MTRLFSTTVAAAALALTALSPAQAVTVGFNQITSNGNTNVANQLSVDVTQPGGAGGNIQFAFRNAVGTASNVSEIYFDWTNSLFQSSIFSITNGGASGLEFAAGGSPDNLPSGNTISFTADTWASAGNPAPHKGINDSLDLLTIVLDLTSPTGLIADLIGNLRIGLHVTGIAQTGGGDTSESYVNNPLTLTTAVPLPAGIWLFGVALAGLGALKVRRRRPTSMMAA